MKWLKARTIFLKLLFLVTQVTFSHSSYSKQMLGTDTMPLLGAGIKLNLTRPSLKTCLASSKEATVKKEISTEIHYLGNNKNHSFEDYDMEAFVTKNLKLLKKKERSGKYFLKIETIKMHIPFSPQPFN